MAVQPEGSIIVCYANSGSWGPTGHLNSNLRSASNPLSVFGQVTSSLGLMWVVRESRGRPSTMAGVLKAPEVMHKVYESLRTFLCNIWGCV